MSVCVKERECVCVCVCVCASCVCIIPWWFGLYIIVPNLFIQASSTEQHLLVSVVLIVQFLYSPLCSLNQL